MNGTNRDILAGFISLLLTPLAVMPSLDCKLSEEYLITGEVNQTAT